MDAILQNSHLFQADGRAAPRVALYLPDNGTSGPLGRAAKVARQLVADGAEVTVFVSHESDGAKFFGSGINVTPYDPKQIWRLGQSNALWQLAKLKPDILLIDEYPFVAQEHARQWERAIQAATFRNKKCKVMGMSCDIPIYYKEEEAVNLASRTQRLHSIMVTGDPAISALDGYVDPQAMHHIEPKLNYVGFLDDTRASAAAPLKTEKPEHDEILVYLGGTNLAKLTERYISLLANLPHFSAQMQQATWRFVLPPSADMRGRNKLQAFIEALPEAIQQHIVLDDSGSDFKEKLSNATMVISGGGQTAIESVLIEGKPTVIFPGFVGDQFARAKDYAARFPERVAALDIPMHRVKTIYTRYSHYPRAAYKPAKQTIHNFEWMSDILAWAKADPACADTREAMERIFETRHTEHPKPKIMLDGAQHISTHVMRQAATYGPDLSQSWKDAIARPSSPSFLNCP